MPDIRPRRKSIPLVSELVSLVLYVTYVATYMVPRNDKVGTVCYSASGRGLRVGKFTVVLGTAENSSPQCTDSAVQSNPTPIV